jgi:hypothetical protein
MAGTVIDGAVISGITVTSATAFPLPNVSGSVASTQPGRLIGGTYFVETTGTFGTSGTIQVQRLGPDAATWENVGSGLTSSGATEVVQIPNGGYRVEASGTITSGFCGITRIPS